MDGSHTPQRRAPFYEKAHCCPDREGRSARIAVGSASVMVIAAPMRVASLRQRRQLHAAGGGQDRNITGAASLRALASTDKRDSMLIDPLGRGTQRPRAGSRRRTDPLRLEIRLWAAAPGNNRWRAGEPHDANRLGRCLRSRRPEDLSMPGTSGRQCCRPCPYGVADSTAAFLPKLNSQREVPPVSFKRSHNRRIWPDIPVWPILATVTS